MTAGATQFQTQGVHYEVQEQKGKISQEAKRKIGGVKEALFNEGFIRPIKGGRISGVFGSQRILNGIPKNVHNGFDIAVPRGTPVKAMADGKVIFLKRLLMIRRPVLNMKLKKLNTLKILFCLLCSTCSVLLALFNEVPFLIKKGRTNRPFKLNWQTKNLIKIVYFNCFDVLVRRDTHDYSI